LAWILGAASSVWAQSKPPGDMDDYAARVLKTFDVPGLSVAIVKDGKLVFAKGYGVRKLGEPAPVDENTLFPIGSNTKAFTSALLASLVDAGKLSWDDPVYRRLPGFQMYDPYVSHEMTIRDLLTHRSGMGLGEGDLLFWPTTTYTRDEIIYRLRFMKPATSFRSRFAYDNLMYIAAGQIIPAVTGATWESYLRGAPKTDWVAAFKSAEDQQFAQAASFMKDQDAHRSADSKPALAPEKYAGVYQDAWYGPATIRQQNGGLVFTLDHTPAAIGDLQYWQYDTFKAHWRDRTMEDAFLTFTLKPDGSIDHFTMKAVSPLADFSFDYQDLLFTPVEEANK
jgi:hypothetical protein